MFEIADEATQRRKTIEEAMLEKKYGSSEYIFSPLRFSLYLGIFKLIF